MGNTTRYDPAEGGEVLEATEARQGGRGWHILWVLIASTVLAAIVLFVSLAFYADDIDGQGPGVRVTDKSEAVTTPPEP
jgi:hypothetical protein